MPDEPDERAESGDPTAEQPAAEPPAFEAPHPNGAAQHPTPRRGRAPWEFTVLALFVALIAIAIILGWTLFGSRSPERLDESTAAEVAAICTTAQTQLKALPNDNPVTGADRVARLRSEDAVLRTMVQGLAAVQPRTKTQINARRGWSTDWSNLVDARERYATGLENSRVTGEKVQFRPPKITDLKPVTARMDDYVRENHPRIDPCFTRALQAENVEGPRTYEKVTE